MNDRPHPLRQALWPLGLLYGCVAGFRNWLFDARLKRIERLAAPVVSVGNLTVGGTGKTPTVAWLSALARRHGRRPGVLARGYGRVPGAELNDEGQMLAQAMPWLLQQQDPDRVAAGRRLLAAGADFVILDDGFQHRRLHRDIDLLCLDATAPFGNGQCLPAGDLREWRSGLERASLVLLTRAGHLDGHAIAARIDRIRELAADEALPVFACTHEPVALRGEPGGGALPPDALRGQRAVLLSAIARPQSLRATAEELGIEVVQELRFVDHHVYTDADVAAALAAAERASAVLLTTEKDDVKLARFAIPRHVLAIGLRFLGDAPTPAQVGLA
ncbi:MAG: tetraacyldisaccharide 4'-kinase [Planctomycetes bacterium]|nr:tetraacyldisaccharide 4'-kinase [Planctomycetota bacterium]